MNELDLLLAQNKDFTFVGVRFAGSSTKTYHYKTLEKFEEGDLAVVNVNGEFKIVEVIYTDCMLDLSSHINYKWIVQKVDTTEYDRCREVEKELTRQLNSARITKLRKGVEADLEAELGADEVKKLVRL